MSQRENYNNHDTSRCGTTTTWKNIAQTIRHRVESHHPSTINSHQFVTTTILDRSRQNQPSSTGFKSTICAIRHFWRKFIKPSTIWKTHKTTHQPIIAYIKHQIPTPKYHIQQTIKSREKRDNVRLNTRIKKHDINALNHVKWHKPRVTPHYDTLKSRRCIITTKQTSIDTTQNKNPRTTWKQVPTSTTPKVKKQNTHTHTS